MNYSESTIGRRAYNISYQMEKSFQHFRQFVYDNSCGNRFTGYMVKDLYTVFFYEWGCYRENFDHLWNLDDVAKFLKGEYETRGLVW